MGVKRKAEHIHPSRQGQVPAEPAQKRMRPHTADGKPFKRKAHPVNEVKSQIRSLQRLLSNNEKLPADVRVEKERALQFARHELEAAGRAQARSDMIGRYHKIRFFDRQKAAKRLKRAQKELAAFEEGKGDGQERDLLAKKVEDATVEVNYAQYYPLDRHYVSLFPRQKVADGEEDGTKGSVTTGRPSDREREGDQKMWDQIKQSMVDGTLDALRNGKLLPLDPPTDLPQKSKPKANAKQRAPAKGRVDEPIVEEQAATKDDDEDSEGGFFE